MCVQIVQEIYLNRPPAIQLDLASDATWQKRYRNAALVMWVPAILVCPLLPLAIIALWNAFMPRRLRARRDRAASAASDGIKDDGKSGLSIAHSLQVLIEVEGETLSVRYAHVRLGCADFPSGSRCCCPVVRSCQARVEVTPIDAR